MKQYLSFKTSFLFSLMLICVNTAQAQQDTVVAWMFNTPEIMADIRKPLPDIVSPSNLGKVNQNATLTFSSLETGRDLDLQPRRVFVYTDPTSGKIFNSYQVYNMSAGDYFMTTFSTKGHSGINVTGYLRGNPSGGKPSNTHKGQMSYRIGNSGEFTNIGPVYDILKGSIGINSQTLPAECNNQDIIQVKWELTAIVGTVLPTLYFSSAVTDGNNISSTTTPQVENMKIYANDGNVYINNAAEKQELQIYDLSGQAVQCILVERGINVIKNLPKGFYIIAGSKICL